MFLWIKRLETREANMNVYLNVFWESDVIVLFCVVFSEEYVHSRISERKKSPCYLCANNNANASM